MTSEVERIFVPTKLPCEVGDFERAEVLYDGDKLGRRVGCCGACEYYTAFELAAHSRGEKEVVLIQLVVDGMIRLCTPLDGRIREEVDMFGALAVREEIKKRGARLKIDGETDE